MASNTRCASQQNNISKNVVIKVVLDEFAKKKFKHNNKSRLKHDIMQYILWYTVV